MPEAGLYTVEYEELRPGVTGEGIVMKWFAKVEPFTVGYFDDAQGRAHKYAERLEQLPATFRNVSVHAWKRVRG
jgi:hypothetical protein